MSAPSTSPRPGSASAPRAARVRVCASTSNLGAGFDCVGMAVDRWLTASVEVRDLAAAPAAGAEVAIERAGTLATLDHPAATDLLVAGFAAACAARGHALPARLDFRAASDIPVARGLGSSATAVVAGALLANEALALGLAREEIASVCAHVEGHPDNVTPSVHGGAVLAVVRAGAADPHDYVVAELAVHQSLGFAFAVPDFELSTRAARAALPATLPHATAARAAAKAAALVHGLTTGRGDLLASALDDVLHVPFRRAMIRGHEDVVAAATRAGAFGATLSGAGPTLVAITPRARTAEVAQAMCRAWEAHGVRAEAIVMDEQVRRS